MITIRFTDAEYSYPDINTQPCIISNIESENEAMAMNINAKYLSCSPHRLAQQTIIHLISNEEIPIKIMNDPLVYASWNQFCVNANDAKPDDINDQNDPKNDNKPN